MDQLLGRGRVPMSSSIDIEIINQFLAEKVASVRLSTDNAPPPTFTHAAAGLTLNEFGKLSVDDVTSSVRQLPEKKLCRRPNTDLRSEADHRPTCSIRRRAV